MVLIKRDLARKTGQISTHYSTEPPLSENGTFRPISGGKSSGTITGGPRVEQRVLCQDYSEVKTTGLVVPARYPPGIVTVTRYGTSQRPESALIDTLNARLEPRVTLRYRKVMFSTKQ